MKEEKWRSKGDIKEKETPDGEAKVARMPRRRGRSEEDLQSGRQSGEQPAKSANPLGTPKDEQCAGRRIDPRIEGG